MHLSVRTQRSSAQALTLWSLTRNLCGSSGRKGAQEAEADGAEGAGAAAAGRAGGASEARCAQPSQGMLSSQFPAAQVVVVVVVAAVTVAHACLVHAWLLTLIGILKGWGCCSSARPWCRAGVL